MPQRLEEEDNYQNEAIAVKCEYNLSHFSSPEATMSPPELEPLNHHHLLAQMNTSQHHLESPEPLEEEMNFNHAATQNMAPVQRTPRPRQKPQALTMDQRLQLMPEKRPLPWRPGVEPGADNETGGESRRKQIRFGCLLATRGEIQEIPCNTCASGRGKFEVCVALEGFFRGACASCQLSGRPNRCSIKQQDDVPESSPANTPGGGGVLLNNGQGLPILQSPTDAPKAKRRRKSKEAEKPKDTIPDWESQRPQWEQELGDSQARQQMKDIVQRPWATVNPQMSVGQPSMMMNGVNGVPQSMADRPAALSWASVNQPSPIAGMQGFGNVNDTNGASYRMNIEQGRREDTATVDDGSVALIDTLPKNKQRQVYGLVSGLQGGIEHLQRELDSLKKALGIED